MTLITLAIRKLYLRRVNLLIEAIAREEYAHRMVMARAEMGMDAGAWRT